MTRIPDDVRALVIAARVVAFGDQPPTREAIKALDKASEAFASRVPWDNEPEATREDAQPVASAYRVRPEMNDPEEWTLMHPERAFDYLDRSGWETQPLYTHPAPDALRVAYERWRREEAEIVEVLEAVGAYLAALQAEQKGGA